LFFFEIGGAALSLIMAMIWPTAGSRFFSRMKAVCALITKRRFFSVVLVGVMALALRAAILPIEPIHQPFMTDEFSYLLMADTFSHGRLTNPTHAMWTHFETFHVNQNPTYCSMYYPIQGAFLALGKVLFGNAFWGVWLSCGLMCACFCWALQGWMPASWAFLGGCLAVVRLASFSYWANSYWGGSAAAIGGALLLGAIPRIARRPCIRYAVILGVGLAILGNSRPYEACFMPLRQWRHLLSLSCEPNHPGHY